MKTDRYRAFLCCLCSLPLFFSIIGKDTTSEINGDVRSTSNPADVCSAANTCGSVSSPCSIDIRRRNSYATATSSIPQAKSNTTFCIKVGTTVIFRSSSKNTGFVIDFISADPFDHEGLILGGGNSPVTVIAKRPGSYIYTIGACTPGTVKGMCGNAESQLIISAD